MALKSQSASVPNGANGARHLRAYDWSEIEQAVRPVSVNLSQSRCSDPVYCMPEQFVIPQSGKDMAHGCDS